MTRAALPLLLTACSISVPLAGKRCAATEPRCLPGYVCVEDLCVPPDADGGSDGGNPDECPFDVDPAASACAGLTWYLSPTGTDAADGKTPATARLTPPATGVAPGDTLRLLGGAWTQVPGIGANLSGSSACPVVITGEPDGGTVLLGTFDVEGGYLVIRHLVFSPEDENGVDLTGSSNHLTFQFDTFRTRVRNLAYPTALNLRDHPCTDCVARECLFESPDGVTPVDAIGPRFAFRGNRVRLAEGRGPLFAGGDARVEGNEFFGTFNSDYFVFSGPGALMTGNVFHDILAAFNDKVLVSGAVRVSRNTLARVSGNLDQPLFRVSRFDNNLVMGGDFVVDGPAGEFNVFDPGVLNAYFDGGTLVGTDRYAPVNFERDSYEPLAGSSAIDRADPTLPVPPGGGPYADVGAIEKGARRLSDGRYCLLDPGP